MNSEETKSVVHHIDAAVVSIKRRIRLNSYIYSVTGLMIIVLFLFFFRLSVQQQRNFLLASESYKVAMETKARQDAADERAMDYIKSVVQAWDKLQRDNPRLRVPKAPVDRPIGVLLPTDAEMNRSRSPTPTAPPVAKKKMERRSRPKPPAKPTSLFDYIFPKPTPKAGG